MNRSSQTAVTASGQVLSFTALPICLLVPWLIIGFAGCDVDQVGNGAAVLPNERVAFPVKDMKVGEVMYVAADALRLDKTTHKLYVYTAAPTFTRPVNVVNIAIRRNDKGFDVDLSANADMFIPIDKPPDSVEAIVTSVTAPAIPPPSEAHPAEAPKEEKKP